MKRKQLAAMALAVSVGLGLASGVVGGAAWAQGQGAQDAATLTIVGQGQATAAPDMATLRLGVVAANAEAAVAVQEMSAQMAEVLARLEAAGIADRDVQTSGLSVQPRYNRQATPDGAPAIDGFEASTEVTVRVRDLDTLGPLLDAVSQGGANLFRNLSFGLQEPVSVQDAARQDAVADALRKAKLYADAAGVGLGPVLSITEHGGMVEPRMMRAAAEGFAGGSVPVAAGELSLSAEITVTYALSPQQ